MAGQRPITPPHTPNGATGGGVQQGNVINKGIHAEGGVVTGNNYGYNVIAGKITIAIEAGTSFTANLRSLTSVAVIMSTKLGMMEDKVSSMSYTLRNINDLVAAQARDEGITMEREGKGFAQIEEGASEIQGGHNAEDGQQSILSMRCYSDLTKASQGIAVHFRDLDRRISVAREKINSWNSPLDDQTAQEAGAKRPLTEDERAQLFLSERDITDMGDGIECHKTEINMKFILFEAVLASNNGAIVKRTVLDMFTDFKSIVEYLRGGGPRPHALGENNQGQLGMLNPTLHPLPDRRPLNFPDVSRLTSLYAGWLFRKGFPPDSTSASTRSSWEFAVATRMPYSTEDLFLKVLAQMAERVKRNRTLRDDRRELLRSDSRRKLAENLLRHQNATLQKDHPQLEWKLAGLECRTHRNKGSSSRETRKIEVILKTQWRPDFLPSGALVNGQGGIIGGSGINLGRNSVGASVRQAEVSAAGGTRASPATRGVNHDGRGARGEEMSFRERHGRGRTVEVHKGSKLRNRRSHHGAGATKSKGITVIRQPQLVIVKEGGKDNAKQKTKGSNSGHKRARDERSQSQFYIELRRPGIYGRGRGGSHDVSSSQTTSLAATPSSSPRLGPRSPQAAPVNGVGAANTPAVPAPAPIIPDYQMDMTAEEEAEIVEELFAEWEEVTDRKGKKRSRSSARFRERASDHQRNPHNIRFSSDDSDSGISRRLMRQVEIQSHLREERIISEMESMSEMHRRAESRSAGIRRMDEAEVEIGRTRVRHPERSMPREREILTTIVREPERGIPREREIIRGDNSGGMFFMPP